MNHGRNQSGGERGSALAGPIRTCVGCRHTDDQARLMRIVAVAGRLTADPCRRLAGRGAYVHRGQPPCLERAVKGGLMRALRVAGPPSEEELAALRSAAGGVVEKSGETCKAEVQ